MTTQPKIAIFYDWLNQWGGAEKVLLNICQLYPTSPIYTIVHDPTKTAWLSPKTTIKTSAINHLPFSHSNPIFYTPLYDLALEQFDFSQFDIVISTTSTIGHCLLTLPKTMFVCYFHNINRYLYQTPSQYRFLSPLLGLYRHIDRHYSHRPDYLLCNSQTVSNRISYHYQIQPQIINPGINVDFFKPLTTTSSSQPYFLTVSRLVAHKNIDLVIKSFHHLPYQLKIVGTGRCQNQLRQLAKHSPNIEFLGSVSDKKLLSLYQNCTALICPQLEDFGLTPIEAQACGKPVVAYNRGGNTETIISGVTGVFFNHMTEPDLTSAINQLLRSKFNPHDCRQQAIKFSDKRFMLNFKQTIDRLWLKYQTTTS